MDETWRDLGRTWWNMGEVWVRHGRDVGETWARRGETWARRGWDVVSRGQDVDETCGRRGETWVRYSESWTRHGWDMGESATWLKKQNNRYIGLYIIQYLKLVNLYGRLRKGRQRKSWKNNIKEWRGCSIFTLSGHRSLAFFYYLCFHCYTQEPTTGVARWYEMRGEEKL